jgi:peroxiredoxin
MLIARRPLLAGFGLIGPGLACSSEPLLNEPGAEAPSFLLEDFQPKSARFEQKYGAEEFRGSVLLLPLFAAWCPNCVACAYLLNDLSAEWQAEGLNVRLMSINSIDGKSSRQKLIDACDFPLLQDTNEAKVWERLSGTKDDHYLYTPAGVLDVFFDYEGGERVDAFSEPGKARLRDAIIAAGG